MASATEKNRRLVSEAWSTIGGGRNPAAIERYFAEGYVRHSNGNQYSRDELRAILESLRRAFPDLETVTVDVVAEVDRVAYRWQATGTHLDTYMGIPATHKRIAAGGIKIARIESGLIAEEWSSWDKVSFLYTLGIIPVG